MNSLSFADAGGNIHPLVKDEVHFGFDLAPLINASLQKAAQLIASKCEALEALKEANQSAPDQLEVLIALYKFYFYQGQIEQAEDLVFQTLIKASLQGGFSHKWDTLTRDSADWSAIRGPARIFLYSLKALAFIRLRQYDYRNAQAILTVLSELDPDDQVGADVIRALLDAMLEEEAND